MLYVLPWDSFSEIDVLECQRDSISPLAFHEIERVEMAVRAADKIASDDGIQLGCSPQGALFGKDIQLITKVQVGPTGNPFSQLGWQP